MIILYIALGIVAAYFLIQLVIPLFYIVFIKHGNHTFERVASFGKSHIGNVILLVVVLLVIVEGWNSVKDIAIPQWLFGLGIIAFFGWLFYTGFKENKGDIKKDIHNL